MTLLPNYASDKTTNKTTTSFRSVSSLSTSNFNNKNNAVFLRNGSESQPPFANPSPAVNHQHQPNSSSSSSLLLLLLKNDSNSSSAHQPSSSASMQAAENQQPPQQQLLVPHPPAHAKPSSVSNVSYASSMSNTSSPVKPAALAANAAAKRVTEYKIIAKIGSGTFSEVYKCRRITDDIMWACKVLKKKYADENHVNKLREVQALRRLNPHPNILKLEELIFDPQNGRLILICELMDMNLYEFIKNCNKSRLSESKIRDILYQIVKAVQHMHSSGIFHRDIKPENILVKTAAPYERLEVKLADFGSCKGIFSRHPYTEYISTRWYRAPECLLTDGYYSYPMDVWSIGCVYFETTTFRPLFPGSNELDQINKIHELLGTPSSELLYKFKKSRALSFEFPKYEPVDLAKNFSSEFTPIGLDLLRKFLSYDPDARISAKDALIHPFLSEAAQADRIQATNNSGTPQPQPNKLIITQSKVPLLVGGKSSSIEIIQQQQQVSSSTTNKSSTNSNFYPVEQQTKQQQQQAGENTGENSGDKPQQIKVFLNKSVINGMSSDVDNNNSPVIALSPSVSNMLNIQPPVQSVIISGKQQGNSKSNNSKTLAAVAELAGTGAGEHNNNNNNNNKDNETSTMVKPLVKRSIMEMVEAAAADSSEQKAHHHGHGHGNHGNTMSNNISPLLGASNQTTTQHRAGGGGGGGGAGYSLPQESYEEAKALILQSLHQRQQTKRHNTLIWKKFYNHNADVDTGGAGAGGGASSVSPQLMQNNKPTNNKHRVSSDVSPVTLTIADSTLTTSGAVGGPSVASMALFKELFSATSSSNSDTNSSGNNNKPSLNASGRRSKELVLDVYKKPLGKYNDRQTLPKIQENLAWLTASGTGASAANASPTGHHLINGGGGISPSHHHHNSNSTSTTTSSFSLLTAAAADSQFGANSSRTSKANNSQLVHIPTVAEKAEKSNVK